MANKTQRLRHICRNWYNCRMNGWQTLVAAAILPAVAVGGVVSRLPVPETLDTEVSAHCRLDLPSFVDTLNFSLAFDGTESNNVEIAFGRDADGDGALAAFETETVVGWRCGRYFAENFRTGEAFEEMGVGTNGTARSLDWRCRVGGGSAVKSLAVTNEAGAALLALSAARPGWAYGRNWNLMRLTARGVGVRDERFEVDVRTKGVFILLR